MARLKPAADPNVIPFIDVLLVLLIIFMVTAPAPTSDIRLDLPPPNPRYLPIERREPTMIVLREGSAGLELFVDGEAVELSQLGARTLEHALGNNPGLNSGDVYADARIVLRADQRTAYGNVVDVMALLQEEGFAKVGIFSEPAQDA